jgi:hypothetical protein
VIKGSVKTDTRLLAMPVSGKGELPAIPADERAAEVRAIIGRCWGGIVDLKG